MMFCVVVVPLSMGTLETKGMRFGLFGICWQATSVLTFRFLVDRLRTLAGERKPQFETGGFAEKRALACEIMQKIRALDPPGRFLRKTQSRQASGPPVLEWEEVSDETAIHKACQAMRDIDRPDRKDRIDRKRLKQLKKLDNTPVDATTYQGELGGHFEGFRGHTMHHPELPDDMLPNDMVAEAMNKALGSVPMPNIHGL